MDAVWTINTVGTPVAPITFGAWGDPNLPRPIFRGAKSAYELGKDTWTNVAGTSIWYTTASIGAQHGRAGRNGPGRSPTLRRLVHTGNDQCKRLLDNQSMVRGTYFYEDATDRFYVWRTDNLKPDHAAGRDIYIGVASNDGTNAWSRWTAVMRVEARRRST